VRACWRVASHAVAADRCPSLPMQTVTTMIVSHDAAFLDNVITDVIAYESFKLRRYRGNLTEFVKVRASVRGMAAAAAARQHSISMRGRFPRPAAIFMRMQQRPGPDHKGPRVN
jgi:hypothetical protein